MNELASFMKLELSSNELLIECFGSLPALDIFHSFVCLNSHVNKRIQTILIHFNLSYSLHLSNKKTCDQFDIFLSYFSFDGFSHLPSIIKVNWFENRGGGNLVYSTLSMSKTHTLSIQSEKIYFHYKFTLSEFFWIISVAYSNICQC